MAKRKNYTWVRWSEDEVRLLKKLFPKGKAWEVAELTGRPLTSVKQKAYDMGMRTRERRLWSADEIEILKKLYPKENFQRVAEILGRRPDSVSAKACQIGLRERKPPNLWTPKEKTLVKKLWPNHTASEIAKQLGRSVATVRDKASKLGAKKYDKKHPKKYHAWSKKELKLLKNLYPSRTAQEIADQIGRSVLAVRQRIFKLGLKKRKSKSE
jgi:hypothetical protein